MWYKFEKDNPVGICRVKNLQVAFYDMERGGDCFDESFYSPKNSGEALEYVETVEEENWCDRRRVFVHMDNGDVYELLMKKLSKEQFRECNNFYGGKNNAEQNRKVT